MNPSHSKKFAAVFPGQGSQYPGMVDALRDNFPWTVHIYEEASEAIKENLLQLCHEGPAELLQLTHNAQPCLLVTGFAWSQVLKKELDFHPAAGAGHSLGEYTALLTSGALTLLEATRLVRLRGQLMQSAVPQGKGKMAAVVGLDDEKVVALCEKATEGETSLVVAANFNAPGQVVIAGHAGAVERAEALTKTSPEFKVRKVIPLNVSAPFHCPLMKKVAEEFFPHLKAVQWKSLSFPIAFNLDAKLRSEGEIAPLMRDQIDHPVLWSSCVRSLQTAGIEYVIEAGPGRVLTGLVKRIVDNVKTFSLDSLEDFKVFEKFRKELV